MKEGYKFVYSLLDRGNVIYIGCAKDVLARYKQHVNLHGGTSGEMLRKYLIKMKESNLYPDLNIIAYLPENEALQLEANTIMSFSRVGHKLTNMVHSFIDPRLIVDYPSNASYKEVIGGIKYKIALSIWKATPNYAPSTGRYIPPPKRIEF
jgi:predicted GIY-YIG superfamily endonuclease